MIAELTDVRCYYELLGSGDPLLLIPGLGTTAALWEPAVGELSQQFSLVLFDNRGVGRSVAKCTPHMLSDLAVDVIELMDHLQLDRAHIMGLSLGGIIAQQVAIDHPSRVDRLVLVSCGNRFGPYLRQVAHLLARALRHFPPEYFRRTVELLGTGPEYFDAHADEIEKKIALAVKQGIGRGAVARQLRCLAATDGAQRPDDRILAPTLCVGCEHDTMIPARYVQQMSREIPESEFLLVPGSGHNPFLERPEFIVPRVIEFLASDRARARASKRRVEFAAASAEDLD
jgi:pimeloyl-ACP methyl ester carboxylesterase